MYFVGKRTQRGHGLGGIFRGILRLAGPLGKAFVPFLRGTAKKALKVAGKQAMASGAALVSDVLEGKNFKKAARQRGREGLQGVISQAGRAIVGAAGSPPGRRTSKRKRRPTKAGQSKKRRGDIFG